MRRGTGKLPSAGEGGLWLLAMVGSGARRSRSCRLDLSCAGPTPAALAALAELLPDDAERVTSTGSETVSISALRPGDVVLVRSGARVPADGVVTEGEAGLDESMVTGESRPVAKQPGDRVVAGTVAPPMFTLPQAHQGSQEPRRLVGVLLRPRRRKEA